MDKQTTDKLIIKKATVCGSSQLCDYCSKPCDEFKRWRKQWLKENKYIDNRGD